MRLLVVSSDTFPPFRVDVAVLFGAELTGRGHRIDWILQSEGACARAHRTEWNGGRAWVGATDLGGSLPRRIHKHLLGIWNDLKVFPRARSGEYDAIEVKDKFLAGIFAVIAARTYRLKFIYWLSYPYPEHYLGAARDGTARYPWLYVLRGLAFKWLLYRLLLPAADHVFVQSEQMKADIAAQGIPAAKMTAVPMGVDARLGDSPDLSGARQKLPAGVPCVLYLGTLDRVRRMDFLIRVFAKVREQVPASRLYIVGSGVHPSDETLLADEAARLNLGDSVVFVGQLPRAEALRYVQESDVCASPFYPTPVLRSTSPTKLVEYMAMGKPVVANDHPEQKRVIEESGAGYCVPYDEEAFAAALVCLLRDPERARAMGARGRDYALARRSYSVIADGVERALTAVVGAPT